MKKESRGPAGSDGAKHGDAAGQAAAGKTDGEQQKDGDEKKQIGYESDSFRGVAERLRKGKQAESGPQGRPPKAAAAARSAAGFGYAETPCGPSGAFCKLFGKDPLAAVAVGGNGGQ